MFLPQSMGSVENGVAFERCLLFIGDTPVLN